SVGIVIYLFAMALRIFSIRALGRNWSISSKEGLGFTRSGLYAYIRHPYYLGVFFESLSIPIIFESQIALIISLVLIIPLEVIRANEEEKKLKEAWGWQYIRYKREINFLFPSIKK